LRHWICSVKDLRPAALHCLPSEELGLTREAQFDSLSGANFNAWP
jgi:hypothetical protein